MVLWELFLVFHAALFFCVGIEAWRDGGLEEIILSYDIKRGTFYGSEYPLLSKIILFLLLQVIGIPILIYTVYRYLKC